MVWDVIFFLGMWRGKVMDSFVMFLFINSICDYFNLPWQNKYVTKFSANVAKNLTLGDILIVWCLHPENRVT